MKKMRVGIVGAGNIARSGHLPAYKELRDIAEVTAIADLNEERAKEAAQLFNVPRWYGSAEALLEHEDVQLIDICVWNQAHAPIAIAAARAGKAVLCEKPLASSLEAALETERVIRETRTPFMCGMASRFSQEVTLLKEMIDRDEMGTVYYVKTGYVRRRGTPVGWFTDLEKSGGGPVIDIGVHNIDCAWYLMGKPRPVRVSASAYAPFGDFEVRGVSRWQALDRGTGKVNTEDSAAAFIHFENGAVMFAEASWALNAPEGRYTQLCGEKAGATLDPFVIYRENASHFLVDERPVVQPVNRFAQEIRHFIDCICQDLEPIAPISDGVTVQRMLDAIYRSARSGREVEL